MKDVRYGQSVVLLGMCCTDCQMGSVEAEGSSDFVQDNCPKSFSNLFGLISSMLPKRLERAASY